MSKAVVKRIMQWWFVGMLGAFLILGAALRFHNYAEFPVGGETRDEVAWTMLGASLLQTGTPQSWSYFEAYENVRQVAFGDEYFEIVSPAVDHPPLFSLLPGLMSTLRGAQWDTIPSMKVIRFPVIALGVVNTFLLAVWMYSVWRKSVRTFVAVALMSTIPSIVFLSRLVVSENLLITWLLLALLGLRYQKQRWGMVAILVALFLMPLTKIAGIALALGLLAGSMHMVSRKQLWQMAVAAIAGVVALGAYMAAFDFGLFWQVQFGQAGRDVGFLTAFLTQLNQPTLVEKYTADMWVWLGYVAMIWAVLNRPKKSTGKEYQWWRLLIVTFLAQFAFLMVSIGEHTVHGWYRIVFFPLFVYFLGAMAEELWKKVQWLGLSIVLLLTTFVPRNAVRAVVTTPRFWELQPMVSRLWLVLAGIPVGIEVIWENLLSKKTAQRVWQIALVMFFVIVLMSHVITIWSMTRETYWEDDIYIESGIRS